MTYLLCSHKYFYAIEIYNILLIFMSKYFINLYFYSYKLVVEIKIRSRHLFLF